MIRFVFFDDQSPFESTGQALSVTDQSNESRAKVIANDNEGFSSMIYADGDQNVLLVKSLFNKGEKIWSDPIYQTLVTPNDSILDCI